MYDFLLIFPRPAYPLNKYNSPLSPILSPPSIDVISLLTYRYASVYTMFTSQLVRVVPPNQLRYIR